MCSMPPQNIAILTIGNELLDGRVQDSNAFLIGEVIRNEGFVVESVATVNDNTQDIQDALRFLLARSASVIISGGLGPTSDDLTREAVAASFGVPLRRDAEVVTHLQEYFAARKRHMHDSNLRQADFPVGAQLLPNEKGTAYGFTLCGTSGHLEHKRVFCLPGVPRELEYMLKTKVLPLLSQTENSRTPQCTGLLKIFGRSESEVASIIEALSLPENLHIGYRASFPEVHLTFVSPHGNSSDIQRALKTAREALGEEYAFAQNTEETLESLVAKLLKQRAETITFAESCTGGMLASTLTSVPGASEVFHGSVVSYANAMKVDLLGVPSSIIEQYGAVSAECAAAMAQAALQRVPSTYALAVTGIAGPTGGSTEKPVGTFYIGLATPDGYHTNRYFFVGNRERIRRYSTTTALDVVRRALLGYPLRNGTPS